MHYHLILTEDCNSRCRYCYGKSIQDSNLKSTPPFSYDFSVPPVFSVPIEKLQTFLEKDTHAVVIFYGGEPLLEIEKIKEIVNTIAIPYRMQTNGLLLDEVPVSVLSKIDKILISLDGTRERTDYNRGTGTFDRVMNNICNITSRGYEGELIARMTIAQEFPDIFHQVRSLLSEGFTSIHWQLDAGFYGSDFNERTFSWFVEEYTQSLDVLIAFWMEKLEQGEVIRLYPFIGIVESLLSEESTLLRCGAGHAGYAICTDGRIVACPIMMHITDFVAGTLDTHPHDLKPISIEGRCRSCPIVHICGGRCLYWNKAGLWPENGDDFICKTIFHLVQALKQRIPEIMKLIQSNQLSLRDFSHEKYFGPEIIP